METWIWIIGALLVGAALGGVGAFLVARRRWADAARAEELQRELDGYRKEVGDHFVHTAELVNNLTRSYKAVYDHLEQGAYRLVDEDTLRKQLGNVDAESVKLEYIGRRDAAAVLGPAAAASGTDVAASGPSATSSEMGGAASGTAAVGNEAPGSDGQAATALAADPPPDESGAWAGSTDAAPRAGTDATADETTDAATPAKGPLGETGSQATDAELENRASESAPWNREPESADEHSLDDDAQPDESGPLKEEGTVR